MDFKKMMEKETKRVIFASSNPGKIREVKEILKGWDVVSMEEAGITMDIDETGETYEENAIIKAKAVRSVSGSCIVLADDSGMEVDFLNGEPGVYSARYLGEDVGFDEKCDDILRRMEGVPEDQRTARFVCAIAAVLPDGSIKTVRGTMEGRIGYEKRGEKGFGYDPIFFLPEFNCMSSELSMEQKNSVSHRGKALKMIKKGLGEWIE